MSVRRFLTSEDGQQYDERFDQLSEEIDALKNDEPQMSPNLCNPDTMTPGFVNNNGSVSSGGTSYSYKFTDFIAVAPGEKLHIVAEATGNDVDKKGFRFVCAYDAGKNVLADKGVDIGGIDGTPDQLYIVPDGVAFVRITFWGDATNIMINAGDVPLPYIPFGMIEDDAMLAEKVAELEEAVFVVATGKNMVDPEAVVKGALMEDGSIRTDGAYASYEASGFIEVEKNTDYAFTAVRHSDLLVTISRKYVLLYDEQKNVLMNSYQNTTGLTSLVFNTGSAAYVRVSGYTVDSEGLTAAMQLEKGAEYTGYTPYVAGVKRIREQYPDILRGKKWVVCGDSFTYCGYNSADGFDESVYKYQNGKFTGKYITYPYIIAERNDMEIVDFFRGGRTLANPADGSFTNSITNPACAGYYQNTPEDADYITIYLGINDSHHESGTSGTDGEDVTGVIPLGTVDDQDESTFCGAWNVVLPWLMLNRPNAHIGIIVSNGVDRVEYRTATIAAAKKWGIPYLDLNGDERCPAMIRTVNPDISSEAKNILKQKWGVTASNLHPNTAAHYYQSTFIENWLRTI